jgi:uncharacterized protein
VDVSQEKYVSLTTFKRDGTAVATAVWCTPLDDGRFGFYTSSDSGKAKRLAHTSRVLVQPSDARGRPKAGSTPEEATARLVTGEELEDIRKKIVAKYGFFTKVTRFLNSVGNVFRKQNRAYADRGVIVTPGAAAPSS